MWTRPARYLFSKANKEAITMDAKSQVTERGDSGLCWFWKSHVLVLLGEEPPSLRIKLLTHEESDISNNDGCASDEESDLESNFSSNEGEVRWRHSTISCAKRHEELHGLSAPEFASNLMPMRKFILCRLLTPC